MGLGREGAGEARGVGVLFENLRVGLASGSGWRFGTLEGPGMMDGTRDTAGGVGVGGGGDFKVSGCGRGVLSLSLGGGLGEEAEGWDSVYRCCGGCDTAVVSADGRVLL